MFLEYKGLEQKKKKKGKRQHKNLDTSSLNFWKRNNIKNDLEQLEGKNINICTHTHKEEKKQLKIARDFFISYDTNVWYH